MTADAVRCRPARSADAPRAGAIARSAYAMYVERIGFEPPPMLADFTGLIAAKRLYVLESADNEVRGFCAFWRQGEALHLSNVAVDPAFQGRGYGRLMIELAEREARELGCVAVELYTNVHMTENQALYPRLGYREIARREEEGVSRVFYRKDLV